MPIEGDQSHTHRHRCRIDEAGLDPGLGWAWDGQLEQLRAVGTQLGRVVAEKEALQAVAKQLSAERDEATAEVNALKVAVHSMTERMKSIEAMLEREVKELHHQNAALEVLALSLATERDGAVLKVGRLTLFRTSCHANRTVRLWGSGVLGLWGYGVLRQVEGRGRRGTESDAQGGRDGSGGGGGGPAGGGVARKGVHRGPRMRSHSGAR